MTHGKGREFKKLPSLKPEMIKDLIKDGQYVSRCRLQNYYSTFIVYNYSSWNLNALGHTRRTYLRNPKRTQNMPPLSDTVLPVDLDAV